MLGSSSPVGLQEVVLQLVRTYGLVAVFLYLVLETSLLLHFVPSEVVVPFAAAILVTDPISFAVFVLVATAGATTGSVLAYVLFGRSSGWLLDRYGPSKPEHGRWERWFGRWGESSVFWGRLLPVVRALVSVPAGAAGMDFGRFVGYTAAGTFVFNVSITALVYAGKQSGTVVRVLVETAVSLLSLNVAYVRTHLPVVVFEVLVAVSVGGYLWWHRAWIRSHPEAAKRVTLRIVRAVGLLVGLLLVSSALSVPERAFASLTWAWNDPLVLTALGLSPGQTLLVLDGLAIGGAFLVVELGQRVSVARVSDWLDGQRPNQ